MARGVACLRAVWLPVVVCGLLACSALHLVTWGLHHECEMTYMYSWPQYQKLNLSLDLRRSFPRYSLHLYRETRNKLEPRLDSTPLSLSGVPALFIPGNAGSHKQARSSASIALQMHRHEFPNFRHFDFFTVNLNEEFSGLFGGVLHRQTMFVAASIRHILSLYPATSPSRPSSVLIIAHSMGGVVASSLFTLPDFPPSLVHTIVALSSPLARPVITFDPTLLQVYDLVAQAWHAEGGVARNVTLVSVSGGDGDVQVPPHLTLTPSHPHSSHPPPHPLSIASTAVPRNWVAADHQAIVWCRRLQLALSRALFLLQTPPAYQLTSDPTRRERVFNHLLFRGWKVPMDPAHHSHTERGNSPLYPAVNPELWTVVTSTPHYHRGPNSRGYVTALSLPAHLPPSSSLLVATDSDTTHWLYLCTASSQHSADCTDLSPLAHILPPRERVVKYARLTVADLEGGTHLVAYRSEAPPPSTPQRGRQKRRGSQGEEGEGEEFLLMEWCEEDQTHSLDLPLWGRSTLHLPSSSSHCTLTTFTIPGLTHMWTGHSATITSPCGGVKGGLVLPWIPHTPLLHDNGTGGLTIPISLQVPLPEGVTASLVVWCPSNCSLSLSVSPSLLPLSSKLLVLYTPFLLPWVTAVAVSSKEKCRLVGEMVVLAVAWGAACVGVPPASDWQTLTSQGLWPAWGPLLVHIVARGLFSVLRVLLDVPTLILSRCLRGSVRRVLAWFFLLLWLPGSALCGAAGLVCVLAAHTVTASGESGGGHHVQGLLACLSVLTLPSLLSWLKGIRYSLQLSPDPLFWPVTAASSLSVIHLFSTQTARSPSGGGCGLLHMPLPLGLASPSSLVSLSLLLYSTTHTYRLAYFISAAILTSLITNHLPLLKK